MDWFMAACTGLFLFLVVWRIFHPFHCTCGYVSWFPRAMLRHLAQKHGYTEYVNK